MDISKEIAKARSGLPVHTTGESLFDSILDILTELNCEQNNIYKRLSNLANKPSPPEELKPCPFCGEERIYWGCDEIEQTKGIVMRGVYIHCGRCDIRTPTCDENHKAMQIWNRCP